MNTKATSKGLLITAALATGLSVLAGCSSDKKGGAQATPAGSASPSGSTAPAKSAAPKLDPVTLNFYLFGEQPKDMQAVVDEFYNQTKDTLNTKIVLNWVLLDNFKDKVGLKIAAGEGVDAVFDAQWLTMPQNIAKGTYINLDSYFNNDKYPGLKKAFPASFLNSNKFVDAKKEEHIYGVPFAQNFGFVPGVVLRKDLRVKYGLPEIKTVADLEAYLDAVQKNEKGAIPFGVTGGPGGLGNWLQQNVKPGDPPGLLAGDLVMMIGINNGKANVVFPGEDLSKLPAPFNTKEVFYTGELTAQRWYKKGLIEKDVISQKDIIPLFKAGKVGAIGGDVAQFNAVYRELAKAVPGAEAEFVTFTPGVNEGKPGALQTDFKAWNFISIPASSKNADRVMMFFDWLYANQRNHDLFELGIEGKHWTAVGDDKFKRPDNINANETYNFPGYELTWNPTYVRQAADWPDNIVKIAKYMSDPKSYTMSQLPGFTLDAEPIKSELAKIGPEAKNARTIAGLGLTDDVEGTYKTALDKMSKMGLEKVREEIKKQVEAFLAAQKK